MSNAASPMNATATEKTPGEQPGAVKEFVEIVKTVVYALAIALVLRVLFFQPFTIPSSSMVPNLRVGDYIIVSKYSYGYSRHSIPFSPPIFQGRIFERAPKRGDIIVFKLPRDGHTDYIKRLVGLPGDRLQVKNGVLFINDQPLPEKYVSTATSGIDCFAPSAQRLEETNPEGRSYMIQDCQPDGGLDNTGVFVVPQGNYFFMGDNRDNSSDSRVSPQEDGVGYVPAENLVGKAQLILLSWNENASLFKPWTWVLDARPSRFFHVLK